MRGSAGRVRAVLSSPAVMRRATGWGVWASIGLWAVAAAAGLVNSVAWVSHLSQLALVLTMLSWWQAARVEASAVDQMEEMITRIIDAHAEQSEDSIRRVVQELIDRTTIEETGQELEVR